MKSFCFSVFILSSVSLFGFTVYQNPRDNTAQLQTQLDSITAENALGEKGMVAAPAWPITKAPSYMLSVDVLYWKTLVGGTSFVATNTTTSTGLPISGFVKNEALDWNFGIKASVGKILKHDVWGLFAEWTYYTTHGSSKAAAGITSTLTPLRGSYAESVQRASSQMKMFFTSLDVSLCRYYFISAYLAMQPLLGIKNTWNKLQQDITYSLGENLLTNLATTCDLSKMWGIGPNIGLNTSWYLGKDFSITGLFCASTLYSYIRSFETSLVSAHPELSLQLSDKQHLFLPNLQWRLGLGWNRYFCQKTRRLDINLAYEALYYFRLNQMLFLTKFQNTFRTQNISEDVSLYGVSLKLLYSF